MTESGPLDPHPGRGSPLGEAKRAPALILGGLWLIAGGYVMTYCFRTQRFGARWLFNVERYHLFPLLGFILWLAIWLRPWLSGYDRRPVRSWVVATGLAAFLMLTHLNTIVAHSRFYQFDTQRKTLAALDRLDCIRRREGITRDQVLAALDTISLRWGSPLDLLAAAPKSRSWPTQGFVQFCSPRSNHRSVRRSGVGWTSRPI